jgi:hypothetical protein
MKHPLTRLARGLRALAGLLGLLALALPARAELRAAIIVRDVTPDALLPVSGGVGSSHPATREAGELTACGLLLENDGTGLTFPSADSLSFSAVFGDNVLARVSGILDANIPIEPTHTHDASAAESLFLGDHPELILAAQQAWGVLGLNTAAHAPGQQAAPLQIGGQTFSKGLGHHAGGSLTILLEERFSAFEALVGLQPCGGTGSVVFRVWVDGEKRFDSGVLRASDPPRPVRVPVAGASELRLEAADAGDGIECDMANWAEARLVPSDTARAVRSETAVDIAPFGRVFTCDPNRHEGTRATRTEEFPAEDFVLETELRPGRDGNYRVPVSANGLACVGVRWLNRRALRTLALELPEGAPRLRADRVRVQAWFGESLWQGQWKNLDGQLQAQGRRLECEVSPKAPGGGLLRTWKVRWILPAEGNALSVRRLVAFTRSPWLTGKFRVELGPPEGESARARLPSRASVEVVDGALLDPPGARLSSRQPATLTVRYARPSALLSELTLLRIRRGGETVNVAVEDVLAREVVYVPAAGVLVCRDDRPVTIAEYRRRIAGRQTILEQVRALPDQTLAQALARTHRAAQNEGPVLLSLACDNAKLIVERNGDLCWHTALATDADWPATSPVVRVRLAGAGAAGSERRLDGGWLPVPLITTRAGPVTLGQRTFVAPADAAGENPARLNRPSVAVAEFALTNTAAADVEAELSLTFVANSKTGQPAELARRDGFLEIRHGHQVLGRVTTARPVALRWDDASGRLTWREALSPTSAAHLTLFLALAGQPLPDALDAAALRAEVERYWRATLASATQIETPEPFLNDLIRSSQVRCLIDARSEADGERVAAWIAAMAYGPLESEAHSVIRGMDFLGHHEFARRALDFFMQRYHTNGFLTTGYTTFGTGWHLWTLGEHWQLTRDTNWLRAHAAELARVGRWVVRQIEKTRRHTPAGEPVRGHGLMPPGVLADWNAYAQHFCLSAYYAAGLRELAGALGAVGHPDTAQFERAGRELAAATLRAFEQTAREAPVVPLRNGTWVPFYPAQAHTPGLVARSFPGEDAGRSWCYNVELGAHQMVPTGVLPARAPRTTWMLEHMEDVSFLESGWFDYPAAENERDWFNLGGFAKVQPYYCRNTEIYALRDDIKPFLRSYFNSLASLVNREVLTFWEHFRHSGAWDKTHETGYFLHQTRTMFVQERGEALWLAAFVPAAWLADGKGISVSNAPTRFGPVSYRVRSRPAEGCLETTIHPRFRS